MKKINKTTASFFSIEERKAHYGLNRDGNPLLELYLKNRANPEQITYLHPLLQRFLKTTYGVLIYQEQLMEILQDLAGFSIDEANEARRALGKKHNHNTEIYFVKFKNGCINNMVFMQVCKSINRKPDNSIIELWEFFVVNATWQFSYKFVSEKICILNNQ